MEYPKQYLFSESDKTIFDHWDSREFFGWWLHHSPDLPVIHVENSNGEEIGILFGWVIFRGQLLNKGDTLKSLGQCEGIANEYDELVGCFNYIYRQDDEIAIITDAGGLLSPVYSQEGRLLASTPTLLSKVIPLNKDEVIRKAFATEKAVDVWYPFGVTPFAGVRRLLPNHTLSLENWNLRRIFPVSPAVLDCKAKDIDVNRVVQGLVESVTAIVSALIKAGHNTIELTAGADTRIILASSRKYLEQCRFQTIAVDSKTAKIDCHIASELSKYFDLRYRQLPLMKQTVQEREEWQRRSGECIDGMVARMGATVKHYYSHTRTITGAGGGISHGKLWLKGDDRKVDLSEEELLQRLHIEANEVSLQLARNWLKQLDGYRVGDILDLAYIEHYLCCRTGASTCGHEVSIPAISPFNCHQLYQQFISLPLSYRMSGQFVKDYMNVSWPELRRIPLNRANRFAAINCLSMDNMSDLVGKFRQSAP